ncbi:MAG: nitrogen fixation protein NifH, partial [Caldilineae bacterium]
MTSPPLSATLAWLLEPDPLHPGVRYLALKDLLGQNDRSEEVRRAREETMRTGPVPAILEAQYPEGYWIKPGGGYSPKYRSTLWQIIFLADFGADGRHPRVRRACEYILTHNIAANGAFSAYQKPAPSGAVLCLNGNLAHALIRLGYRQDARVQKVIEWLAGAIT